MIKWWEILRWVSLQWVSLQWVSLLEPLYSYLMIFYLFSLGLLYYYNLYVYSNLWQRKCTIVIWLARLTTWNVRFGVRLHLSLVDSLSARTRLYLVVNSNKDFIFLLQLTDLFFTTWYISVLVSPLYTRNYIKENFAKNDTNYKGKDKVKEVKDGQLNETINMQLTSDRSISDIIKERWSESYATWSNRLLVGGGGRKRGPKNFHCNFG